METKKQHFKGKEFMVAMGGLHPDYSFHTFELEEHDIRDKYWNIKEGDIVFDVGSSYGSYALTATAMGATVLAFEPEKTVFCDLVANIKLNNWQTKCFAFNLALWSEKKTVNMKNWAPHWPTRAITSDYPTDTLTSIADTWKITRLDWIKIDVEGAEVNVIQGGLETIKRFKPKLLVECHTFLDPNIKDNVKKLLSSVCDYDFEEIDRDPCVILYATPKNIDTNIEKLPSLYDDLSFSISSKEPSKELSKKLKLAFIFGAYSIANRPLDFNNLFDDPRGLTGSDLGVVITAKEMAKRGHDVSLFTVYKNNKPDLWENVRLYNFDQISTVIGPDTDAIISWSEADVFKFVCDKPVRVVCEMLNDFSFCQKDFDNYVDVWTAPSQMLLDHLVKQGTDKNKWSVLPLGCDFSWYKDVPRIPGRVVWTSSGDRGLHLLLQEWHKIKAAVPEANLKIFYNFGFDHINGIEPDDNTQSPLMKEMAHRIRYIKEGIKKLQHLDVEHVGSVSRNRMAEELNKAMVLAYSFSSVSNFTEGFSTSILESCCAGVVPIISSADALKQIYNNVVPMVPAPVEKHMEEFNSLVIKGLTDNIFRNEVIDKCKAFAKKHTWAEATEKLEQIIINSTKYRKNNGK